MTDGSQTEGRAFLRLTRFNGIERFAITDARYNIYAEADAVFVVFRVDAPEALEVSEESAMLDGSPFWELVWRVPSGAPSALIAGTVIEMPSSYDAKHNENITNFYYVEHDSSEDNRIAILQVHEGAARARITGETTDVNFYDGSKPPTRLEVEAEFRYDPTLKRSFI